MGIRITTLGPAAALAVAGLAAFGQTDPAPAEPGPGVATEATPAAPVTPGMTLEDIRLELSAIGAELDALRALQRASGQGTGVEPLGPEILARINALEDQLRAVTNRLEQLSFDVNRIAEDGGRRLSDLDFRVTLMEGGDTAFVPPAAPLGGGGPSGGSGTTPGAGVQTAISEQAEFDAAFSAYEEGRYAEAITGFEAFIATYAGGPLVPEARFWLAESQSASGAHQAAATNYLSVFSGNPSGEQAPDALVGLGVSLALLGQVSEGCLTFDEALARFAAREGQAFIEEVMAEKSRYACP
ncbi:MAG: tetratricopeptide repeat protein [Rubricella sp.]